MSFDVEKLYQLLPALYRLRDDAQGKLLDPTADAGPIKELLTIIAREYQVIDENIDQLYDDMFIETCAEWVVPYIGDLIGVRSLYGVTTQTYSQRGYVANTIAYRRRKGTAAMLEQLAHDLTGWNANVVEFFQRLITNQNLNHLRLQNRATVDLRSWEPLERIGTPFDALARTIDVRRIASGAGKYNIPNIGIFLWRLDAFSLTRSPAVALGDGQRWLFSPLGENRQLFTLPQTEDTITHLAEPINVPLPLSRRVLDAYLGDYYGEFKSLCVFENGTPVTPDENTDQPLSDCVQVCDLSDLPDGSGDWAHMTPTSAIAVDPVLGRVVFRDADPAREVAVTYYYGFSAELGGGEYDRAELFAEDITQTVAVAGDLQAAIGGANGDVAVEIPDSGRYSGSFHVSSDDKRHIEIRAADGQRPLIDLDGGELTITVNTGGRVTLNGLLIANGLVRVVGNVGGVQLIHCTLVPGRGLNRDGTPTDPDLPSLVVEIADPIELNQIDLEIDHSITGALRFPANEVTLTARDSIIAALGTIPAVAADDDPANAAGDVTLERVTVFGAVSVRDLTLASDCIFTGIVHSDRLQEGCVRYSYLPPGSVTPRRYQCVSDVRPIFTSTRYGDPGYAQLSRSTSDKIRTGASDEAEMGVFHDLYQPQRETNLRVRLDEFLRFGLEAGIFYAT